MKILCVVLLFLLSFTSLYGQDKILKVGLFTVPPHIFPTNPPHGAAVDHIRQFAAQYGYKVEWMGGIPFPRLMALLKSGQIDMAPLISKNKEREEFLLYPNDFLFESKPTLIVAKNFPYKEIKTIQEIRGMNFAYIQGAVIPKFLQQPNSLISYTFLGTDNWVENGIALLEKRWVDGILSLNQYTITYEIKNKGLSEKFTAIPLPILDEKDLTYLAVSKKSQFSKELIEQLNNWNAAHSYDATITPYLQEKSN